MGNKTFTTSDSKQNKTTELKGHSHTEVDEARKAFNYRSKAKVIEDAGSIIHLPPANESKTHIRRQNMRDINHVMSAVKSANYAGFCCLLTENPYIQHWKLFEEAIFQDLWLMNVHSSKPLVTPSNSFSLKLVECGYEITERKLELMEMRISMKRQIGILKRWIVSRHLSQVKSLQELCRQSLRNARHGVYYKTFIKDLDYPEKLKEFLLKVS